MMRRVRDQFRRAIRRLLSRRQGPRDGLLRLDVTALLNRDAINLDTPEIQRFLAGKRVLVTGAGGSIGSEICRQIMKFCPARLVLVEQAENALFEIDSELRQRWMGMDLVPYVADICDAARINRIFDTEQPQVIFHCAAHKHVPMMERNPGEAIKNNIFGTKTVADAARDAGAAAFVMVSTDKAVNPTSIMGASKRVAEMYVQSLSGGISRRQAADSEWRNDDGQHEIRAAARSSNATGSTRFVAVRFGNVLGSSGSVIPIFTRQIAAGGPVTVTHPDMKRYFMTIPEASQLVLQAGAIANGGEVFILDMGQPVRILTLARELIRRAGLREGRDIDILYTGIRPGEKLYEELACDDEQTQPTAHPKIRAWRLAPIDPQTMQRILDRLSAVIDAQPEQVRRALQHSVPEFRPAGPSGETRHDSDVTQSLIQIPSATAAPRAA